MWVDSLQRWLDMTMLVYVLWMASYKRVLHLSKSEKRSTRRPPNKKIGGHWVHACEQQKARLHVTCYFHEKSQHTSNSNRAKNRSSPSCPVEWEALSEKLHAQPDATRHRQKATFVKLCLSSGPSLDEPLYTSFHCSDQYLNPNISCRKAARSNISRFPPIQLKIAELMRMKCSKLVK